MKILLSLIICSAVACMKPTGSHPTTFDSQYDCLIEGYTESIVKMKQID